MTLEFEEAVFVSSARFDPRMETCTDCKGTGGAKGRLRRPVLSAAVVGSRDFSRVLFSGADLLGVRRTGTLIVDPCTMQGQMVQQQHSILA